MALDEKDKKILRELQKDCKQSLREIARKLEMTITTVHDRIKNMEKEGVIKGYKTIIDAEKVDKPVIAFINISMRYHYPELPEPLSQREVARQISLIPGVQEVHIVGGEWDILVKARGKDIKEIGDFVIDRLRKIKGVDKTLTIHSWVAVKDSVEINF